jgi:hypothetical protein
MVVVANRDVPVALNVPVVKLDVEAFVILAVPAVRFVNTADNAVRRVEKNPLVEVLLVVLLLVATKFVVVALILVRLVILPVVLVSVVILPLVIVVVARVVVPTTARAP